MKKIEYTIPETKVRQMAMRRSVLSGSYGILGMAAAIVNEEDIEDW